MMIRNLTIIAMVCGLMVTGSAQRTELAAVLIRVAEYVEAYQSSLSVLVAEEHYEQWIGAGGRPSPNTSTGRVRESMPGFAATNRTLVSDFLLLRWSEEGAWLGFRDVLAVDGKPVRDRQERLLKLFLSNGAAMRVPAAEISAESSRYNIGTVDRNINVPLQVLDFIDRSRQERFEFRASREETRGGVRVWRLSYREKQVPYLIRTPAGQGIRATGELTVDPSSGAVLGTELDLNVTEGRQALRSHIAVSFGRDEKLGLLVPIVLTETHEQVDLSGGFNRPVTINGRARYGNFRRFGVETTEQIAPR